MSGVQGARRGVAWSARALLAVLMGAAILTSLLAGCGSSADQTHADQNKARLDHELTHARTDLGLPDSMLQPITSQEQKIASGEGGWNYSYTDAAANYALLYSQLVGVEQTASQTLKSQTSSDLKAFAEALTTRRSQGFSQAQIYEGRLQQSIADLGSAQRPGDYARLDSFIRQQTEALNSMGPAYAKLQQFDKVIRAVSAAGYNSALAQNLYQQDLNAFTSASSAARYAALVNVIDGQITQIEADQTEALPYIGTTLLDGFQASITLLKSYGEPTATFQAMHNADAARLKKASSLGDYLALSQAINQQTASMTLPLMRGLAKQELRTLQRDINYVNGHYSQTDPANGQTYPDAYEYSNPYQSAGVVSQEIASARTADAFQQAYYDAFTLDTSLRALLDNLKDKTPHNQPHATDLTLLRTFALMHGKVVVVSLREQTARFYLNGKLVFWSYVTTGGVDTPSVPGLNYAMEKLQHTTFISPDPPGSPFWYAPTPINYAIEYALYGYFLHDAWWRAEFGPYTNLPHWDPAAFNGGSHGCVNFPLNQMSQVYGWVDLGTPIILY
ncbi:MAG: L,D-transpeptidase [Chloroflexota bacterium]|nr:L,D-transpeptidase [Chloroflexota bacterium]